jgi:hypothetical protein
MFLSHRIPKERRVRTGINYRLITLNTGSPRIIRATKTITHEIHQVLPFRLTGDDKKLKKKYIVDERTYLPLVRPHEKGTAYTYLANGL